jgi:hypothetical protein
VAPPQAAVEAARLALQFWSIGDATIMVAIAGCESGWDPGAQGDSVAALGPTPYQCNGFRSHGLYQVHMPAHYPKLIQFTGSNDPCRWADWLHDPLNNTRIAKIIWQDGGFGPWTCYNNGGWRAHQDDANFAITLALGQGGVVQPTLPALEQLPAVVGLPPPADAFLQLDPVVPPRQP